MPKKPDSSASTIEEKLDEILFHLRRLDRRDRLRTIGGMLRSIISLIPIIILIGSIWYAYKYGDQLLEKIAQQAARQAAIMTEQGTDAFMQKVGGILVR